MSSSSTEVSTFIKSYPIDFYLHDDEGKNVLYIDDASGVHNHSLTLEIINTSARHIELINDKKWSKASVEHHHFELRFRPGVLDINEIKFPKSQDWSIEKQQNDGIISLYILIFMQNQNNTLNAKGKIVLNLQQIKASAGRGARVTQVELKYANLKYQNEKEPLSGNRLQSLSIVNHSGRKDIPLHVGFIGGDDILNDGSPNELHLRIANTTLKTVPLKSISLGVSAKFIISFETGEKDTNPWALGTESQVQAIKVRFKDPIKGIWSDPVKLNQSNSPQWEIKVSDLQKLIPGQSFEIKLSEIKTLHPSGHTNLYIRYENIPGYWDGQFICSIEKSPIVYKNNSVGINTIYPDPDTNKLKVKGNAEITGTLKADKIEGAFAIGMVIMWCGDTNKVPDGWVLCDGIQSPGLTVIVPDLRGRFVLGFDQEKKDDPQRKLGGQGGLEEVTLNENQMPMHNHNGKTKEDGQHKHKLWHHIRSFLGSSEDKDRPLKANEDRAHDFSTKDGEGKHTHGFTTSNAGGNKAHTNMPPFYVLAYIMYTGCPKDTKKK